MPILRLASSLCCLSPTFTPPPLSRASHRLTRINMQTYILQAGRYLAMCTADAVCTRQSWVLAAGATKTPRSWAMNAPGSNCVRTGPRSAESAESAEVPTATVLVLAKAMPLYELRMVAITAAMSCTCLTIAPTAPAFGLSL